MVHGTPPQHEAGNPTLTFEKGGRLLLHAVYTTHAGGSEEVPVNALSLKDGEIKC
jgi:hypothetical protein